MRFFFIVSVLLACLNIVSAQKIDSLIAKSRNSFSLEKIYISYDKESYTVGDKIYLQCFIFQDTSLPKSTSIKIELLSDSGSVLAESVFPIINGSAIGNITIPIFKGGRVFLEANTRNSIEFPARSPAFVQPLLILPPNSSKISISKYTPVSKVKWSFSKEKLINGVTNHVDYLITDQFNEPVRGVVHLLAENKDTICTSHASFNGNGRLIFIPDRKVSYSAIVYTPSDTLYSTLPKSVNGTHISVVPGKSSYNITIQESPDEKQNAFTIIGENDFNVVFRKNLPNKKEISFFLPTTDISNGILRLALLDRNEKLVGEKYVFVLNQKEILRFTNPKSLVTISNDSIRFTNTTADSVDLFASVSVESRAEPETAFYPPQSIIQSHSLQPYLTRYYRFMSTIFNDLADFDLTTINSILNTDSLNKPSWDNMMGIAQSFPKEHENYIHYKAKVLPFNNKGGKNVDDETLNLIIQPKGQGNSFKSVPISKEGIIEDDDLVFTDSARIYFSLNGTKKDKYASVYVITPSLLQSLHKSIPGIGSNYLPIQIDTIPYSPNTSISILIPTEQDQVTTLQNVTVNSAITLRQKTKLLEKRYTKGLFSKQADKSFDLLNDPYPDYSLNVLSYIKQEYLKYSTKARGWVLYLNEAPSSEEEYKTIQVKDVGLIKVFQSGFAMSQGGKPSICVYLKKYDDVGLNVDNTQENKNYFMVAGYNEPTDFLYRVDESKAGNATIYWQPAFSLKNEKQFSLSIPNQKFSLKRAFIIKIEGVTADGNLFYSKEKVVLPTN